MNVSLDLRITDLGIKSYHWPFQTGEIRFLRSGPSELEPAHQETHNTNFEKSGSL